MKPAERLEPSESPDSVETIEGHGDSPRTPVLLDEIQPSMLHTHNDGDVPAARITRHFSKTMASPQTGMLFMSQLGCFTSTSGAAAHIW